MERQSPNALLLQLGQEQTKDDIDNSDGWRADTIRPEDSPTDKAFERIAGYSLCDLKRPRQLNIT